MDDLRIQNAIKNDGWANLFTGLGTRADKTKSTRIFLNGMIPDEDLESMYAEDGLSARIVDTLPDDMIRQGWTYIFNNEKEGLEKTGEKYEEILERIDFTHKIANALKWNRLYGGALILIGAYDGEPLDSPLNIKRIKNIEDIRVIPRSDIMYSTMTFQMNPTLPRYGKVELYPINFHIGNSINIANVHHSRCIELHGVEIPSSQKSRISQEYRYWGISVLQRVEDRLKDLGGAFSSLANLLQEVSVGKYKFKDLADILATKDGGKLIANRIQAIDLMRSVFHSVLMDTEEDFVRDTLSFSGISDVLYQFFMIVSSATGYPITRLFGTSPAGLNSSGDSDTYSYYDMVRSAQETQLKPVILKFLTLISEWQNLELPRIEFNPLEQMTEKEQAELEAQKANTEKIKMETYQGYIDMGIMDSYIVEQLEFKDTLARIRETEPTELPAIEETNEPSEITGEEN